MATAIAKPRKCTACKEKAVTSATLPEYSTEMEHDGRSYRVSITDATVFRCAKCSAIALTTEALDALTKRLRREASLLTPEQITDRRKKLNLSQKELAEHLGVAAATVCRWETGAQIQQRVLDKLLRAFFKLPQLRDFLKPAGEPTIKYVGETTTSSDFGFVGFTRAVVESSYAASQSPNA